MPDLHFKVVTLSDSIETAEQRWLWHLRLPLDKVTLLSGDWGSGKTHSLANVITSWLRRETYPDGAEPYEDPGHVLLLTTESDISELTGIFRAQGCTEDELNYIHILSYLAPDNDETKNFSFDLDSHLTALEEQVKIFKPTLIVLDPLIEFHSRRTVDEKAIRSLMVMLNFFCAKHRVGLIGMIHWNKNQEASRRNRTSGSHQYEAGVKAVIAVERDLKDDKLRHFHQEKMTLGPEPKPLSFRITEPDGLVIWEAVADVPEPKEVTLAMSWLIEALAAGPKTPADCYSESGFNDRTMRRARNRLGPLIVTTEHYIGYKYVAQWELVGPENMWGLKELKTS